MSNSSAKIVDFSNVKDGGNFNKKRIPAGDYAATITTVADAEAKDGIFQYLISIKVNKHASSVLPYYCKLQENQLWKLRNILIAAGLTVPKKKMKVDPSRLVGKVIGITVEDTEYDGKDQSEIAGVFPAAELMDYNASNPSIEDDQDDDEDEDESTADLEDLNPEEDVEEEAEEEAEDEEANLFAAMDRAQLKSAIKKMNPEFKFLARYSDDDLRDAAAAASKADKPATKAPAKPATKAAKPAAKATVSDDELDELDIDDL